MQNGIKFSCLGFLLALLLCTFTSTAAADDPVFYLSPGNNLDGDLAWQSAVGDFTEFDLDDFPGTPIDGLETDDVDIDIDLDGITGTSETVGFFSSSIFTTYGTVDNNTLVSILGNTLYTQMVFEFSDLVTGAGMWVFDDSNRYAESTIMHVTDGNDQTWTSPVLESGNGTSWAVEGFIGVTSDAGIKRIVIENISETTLEPFIGAFEVDHIQVGGIFNLNVAPVADAGVDETVHVFEWATLDGSGSFDPDGHSLTYSWEIVDKPESSDAVLIDPTSPTPSFLLDALGDFTIELVVTDSLGAASLPDQVLISSTNTAPVADAGPDQAVIELGTTVELDGSESYDADGDIFSLLWTVVQKPAGSSVLLSNATSANPTFVADVQGDYIFSLEATDIYSAKGDPDYVTVSFTNVAPVADAGNNQSVLVSTTVTLDGGNSHDANLDLLTYSWSFVSRPEGSDATFSAIDTQVTQFTADKKGEYIISLVVNDGFVDSTPSTVTVLAFVDASSVTLKLQEAIDAINALDKSHFKNKNLRKALTNKLNATIRKVDDGLYLDAQDKLINDILKKMDGCAQNGSPDKNDWIKTCDGQIAIYPLIAEAIVFLDNIILG